MIRASDRVASVLARDERYLDVFLETSPAFEMLRNRTARRTMARLVTVGQAARIAGIEAEVLLERLNALGAGEADEGRDAAARDEDAAAADETSPATSRAAPHHASPPVSAPEPKLASAPAPAEAVPAWLLELPADRIADLDVRDDLRQGREPFQRIMQAARTTADGHVLRLRATFEPVPLFAVLGKQKFEHHTEHLGPDDWRIWFVRSEGAAGARATPQVAPPAGDLGDDVVILDVRGLEPPEPMERTLEALATLPRGKTLVQINVRVPQFLLPKLGARGFTYEVREQSRDLVRIFIRHTHNP